MSVDQFLGVPLTPTASSWGYRFAMHGLKAPPCKGALHGGQHDAELLPRRVRQQVGPQRPRAGRPQRGRNFATSQDARVRTAV